MWENVTGQLGLIDCFIVYILEFYHCMFLFSCVFRCVNLCFKFPTACERTTRENALHLRGSPVLPTDPITRGGGGPRPEKGREQKTVEPL